MRRFFLRLAAVFRRDRAEQELAREITSHIALLEDEYRRRGVPAEEAGLAARRAMGGVERAKDLHGDARSFVWLDDARRDVQYAARMLRRSPGFAAVAIVTMAAGIGATTTLFSLAYGVLLRPLPWSDADRLVRLQETRGGNPAVIPMTISNGTYLAWQAQPSTIEDIGGWMRGQSMTVTGEAEAERLRVGRVTPSLMRVLRARPTLGRAFADSEAVADQADVVMLGFGLWQRLFGGRRDIVGRSVRLDNRQFTVVGVMPRDFIFPDRETQAWIPLSILPVQAGGNNLRLMIFPAIARLRSSVSEAQAATEATSRARGAPSPGPTTLALFGSSGEPAILAAPVNDVATDGVRPAIQILLAAVTLLFITATASLAVLQLSRVAARRRETAVRRAIGAGEGRLRRQWLVESTLLGLVGGLAGLFVAALLHQALPSVLPSDFPRVESVRLDIHGALFAGILTFVTSVVCGMVPTWHGRDGSLVERLSEEGLATDGQSRKGAARMRSAIMAGQLAIACVLLIGAGLLARSFAALTGADRGYDPSGVLTAILASPQPSTFGSRTALLDALRDRLGAVPGVTHIAFGNALPFVTTGGFRGMTMPLPRDPSVKAEVHAVIRAVSPEYFQAMRLRIVQGRAISRDDSSASQPVVVVNKSFASTYLVGQPIGQRLALGINGRFDWDVVGVVDDMQQGSISASNALWTSPGNFGGVLEPPQPELFFAHTQWETPIADLVVVIRNSVDPASLVPALRAAVRTEDPMLALDSVMTMEERVRDSLAAPRTYTVFLSGFALCALLVAGIGLFGVLSYTTAHRTREIGVRTALGAERRDIVGLVIRQAMVMTIGGLVVGLVAAFFLAQSLSRLLYGVSTRDPMSFVVVPVILFVVALIACAAPAWRATRVDPLVALRYE